MEEWADIKGFEGMYQVSTEGRVRSVDRVTEMVRYGISYEMRHKGRVLKTSVNKCGYERVQLTKDSRPYNFTIHRLVATAFIPNKENLPEINHIDGNKRNNNVDNLEWCTKSHNIQHAFKNGLIDKNNMTFNRKLVMRSDGVIFNSLTDAALASGAHVGNVSACCHGRLMHTGGYGFEFLQTRE